MHVPPWAEFEIACARGNLIPVYRELLADSDTPVSAYAALSGMSDRPFLLESVVGGENWAAYSFVGIAPRAVVQWRGGTATVTAYDVEGGDPPRTSAWPAADPLSALADVLGELTPVDVPGLPRFWGGAVGWIAYDCVRAFEHVRAPDARPPGPHDLDAPPLCMVITDTLLIFDNLRQTLKVVATAHLSRGVAPAVAYARACARIDAVVDALRAPRRPLPILELDDRKVATPPAREPQSTFARSDFLAAVARIKDYILAGDAFQVVLSQRFVEPAAGARSLDIYRALRVINPSPYMFQLEFPEAHVTGASPETLVRLVDRKIELRPIAGTRPRGVTREDDDRLAGELRRDPKELAEHLMLIDLGRNDLGRVAAVGSVEVAEQMVVERYSHVMHLTSHVVGTLAADKTWLDVVRAAFPAGTLSGAPKIRAIEIIDELEPHRRGIYGGAVGYVSYTGNVDLAIAIRTLVASGDRVLVQAGAGVVADSSPEAEYDETVNKARAVLRAIAMARTGQEGGA